jgi:hypothetical protein
MMNEKSAELNELLSAMSIMQGELCNAKKDSANPFFKSKYADLAEVINVSKDALSKNGLSVLQFPSFENNIVSVTTVIGHKSGQFMSSTMSSPIQKIDPQSIGSATTYLRRYSYSAIVGIAQEDDDGNHASRPTQKQVEQKPVLPVLYDCAQLIETAAAKNWSLETTIAQAETRYIVPFEMKKTIETKLSERFGG